jgi:hypothetical protein
MRRKLRIEALAVESFEAASTLDGVRGTVAANKSDPNTCYPINCDSEVESCLGTCFAEDTCGYSCGGTCLPNECP